MVAAVAEGISTMVKTLAKQNVPPGVTIAFVEHVRKAAGTLTDKRRLQCSAAKKAGDLQDKLGPETILRGHHHTAWVEAMSRTYRKRVYPPGTDLKRRRKAKTALELSSVLVRECWVLFESVWQVRNDILHSKDISGAKRHNEHLTEQLLRFKYNADTMLQYGATEIRLTKPGLRSSRGQGHGRTVS